jgi:hypothetical protein
MAVSSNGMSFAAGKKTPCQQQPNPLGNLTDFVVNNRRADPGFSKGLLLR